MLIWVAALHCEAKPVIDYFRLKKSHAHHAFDLYQLDNMLCVITGIGKIPAAAATAWVAALHQQSRSIAWINIGTAGSESHPVGSVYWINKITDVDSNRRFYPVPIIDSDMPAQHCLTHNQPNTRYHPQHLFDMEASAFFDTATRFSSGELVHCLKIISDNEQNAIDKDKYRVSQLIQQNMPSIAQFAQALEQVNQWVAQVEIAEPDWQRFLTLAHFSQTQTTQLKNSLRFLLSQNNSVESLMKQTSDLDSSQLILARLEQMCIHSSRNL
ncbi:MAG: adenosylhomocysteine nucleosidase [Gammaproteobacteria bacterium]|jgi:adenosylhomocysteine nucleosidase